MNDQEISQELKAILLYRDENEGAVKRIAKILGLSRRTVYDYLDGKIKINTRFLRSCVIATDGDPDIKRYLEPRGWKLVKSSLSTPNRSTLAEECLDDVPALGKYHTILNDPKSEQHKVKRAFQKVIEELEQNYAKWCQDKGLTP